MDEPVIEAVERCAAIEAHHTGGGELFREDRQDQMTTFRVDGVDRLIHDHPARFMQEQPGEGEALLLVDSELAVPSAGLIEERHEMAEAHPMQCSAQRLVAPMRRRRRIEQRLAQRARR